MKRNLAIDYLRSGVTMLVVVHHAALAYTTFSHYDPVQYLRSTAPVVDVVRWMPLDLIVNFNETFFMALMFLISGLFVLPSLERKGSGRFFLDRMKRLGIPFVISVTVLSPLAFYPSYLLSDDVGRGGFLPGFFDNWTPGPAWFLWVLLIFSGSVALVYRLLPDLVRRMSLSTSSGWTLAGTFLAVSLVTTVPLCLFILPGAWTRVWGPLVFQTWKFLLYFSWFLLGVALGTGKENRSLTRETLRPWPLWLALGVLVYLGAVLGLRAEYVANMPQWATGAISATVYSLCCTFTGLAMVGLSHSFFQTSRSFADSLTANAYGIYVFHYVFVIWSQFSLLTRPLPASLKFLLVLSFSVTASWLLTVSLRKTAAREVF